MTALPDPTASGLEGATARAAIWYGLATAGVKVISLASTFLLARLLDRGEFGVASYALTLGALLEGITGFGVGAATIQRPASRSSSDTAFWIHATSGLALRAHRLEGHQGAAAARGHALPAAERSSR